MQKSKAKGPATIFDHMNFISDKKIKWDTLSDIDRKSFSSYMINRFLSMNYDLIEVVAEFQKYTVGLLEPREVYNLYSDLLPKAKLPFCKYVKSKKSASYKDELVSYIQKHFSVSYNESVQYLDIYFMDENKLNDLINLLQKYGKTEKEIKNLLKTE